MVKASPAIPQLATVRPRAPLVSPLPPGPAPDKPAPVPLGVSLCAVTVAKKLFHAAIVALGYVYVDCVVPDPT